MHWLYPFFYMEAKLGALRGKDKKRFILIENTFFRRTASYTQFDHKSNEAILEVLKGEPIDEKLRRYKSIWQ
jgi:hypothetical protein